MSFALFRPQNCGTGYCLHSLYIRRTANFFGNLPFSPSWPHQMPTSSLLLSLVSSPPGSVLYLFCKTRRFSKVLAGGYLAAPGSLPTASAEGIHLTRPFSTTPQIPTIPTVVTQVNIDSIFLSLTASSWPQQSTNSFPNGAASALSSAVAYLLAVNSPLSKPISLLPLTPRLLNS